MTATNRSKEPCERCGIAVSVERLAAAAGSSPDHPPTVCAACRAMMSQQSAAAVAPLPITPPPIDLTVEDVLTVSCQLCHSRLMVDPSRIGTQITCPDCHSLLTITDANSKLGQQQRSAGRQADQAFDSDSPLEIQAATERPPVYADLAAAATDKTVGLDPVTDDLLSQPLPEVSDASDDLDGGSPTGQPSEAPPLSRREKYRRLQQRVLSPDRLQLRKEARQRKAKARGGKAASDRRAGQPSDRSSRKRQRNRDRQTTFVSDSLGWLKQPVLLVLWLVAAALLSFAYYGQLEWGPLQILERWYAAMAFEQPLASPLALPLAARTAAIVVGCGLVYLIAGQVFGQRAAQPFDGEKDEKALPPRAGSFTTMIQFAVAWLLVGLPFLWLSVLLVPLQIALFPLLLIGLWHNRSIWKVIAVDPFTIGEPNADASAKLRTQPELRDRPRRPWMRPLRYGVAAGAITCIPTAMIFSGGVLAVPGWLLTTGLMIGTAGICGGHCRQLAQRLEPTE